nr:hypothetical protein [Bacteroidota bacterium]
INSRTSGILDLDRGGTSTALTDPDADRILFWDDGEGETSFLTAGDNIAITGTDLDVTIPTDDFTLIGSASGTVSGSSVEVTGLSSGKTYFCVAYIDNPASDPVLQIRVNDDSTANKHRYASIGVDASAGSTWNDFSGTTTGIGIPDSSIADSTEIYLTFYLASSPSDDQIIAVFTGNISESLAFAQPSLFGFFGGTFSNGADLSSISIADVNGAPDSFDVELYVYELTKT